MPRHGGRPSLGKQDESSLLRWTTCSSWSAKAQGVRLPGRSKPVFLRGGWPLAVPNSSSEGLDFFAIDGLESWAIPRGQLGFQLGDAGFQRSNLISDLGRGEARGY